MVFTSIIDHKVSGRVVGLAVLYNIVPYAGGVKLEAKDRINLTCTERGKPYVHFKKGAF